MSGSGRKRSSKWDLREESHFETDSWPRKESRQISPELARDDGSKRSSMETINTIYKSKQDWGLVSKEPLSGTRDLHKENYNVKDYYKDMEGTAEWEADKLYDTRMSPGLDGWRRQSSNLSDRTDRSRGRSRSQSRSRSRSRSRSPRSFKRDSGFNDRNRSRSRVSNHLCRDFASGRCRRGGDCQFLHSDNQNLDDSWENRSRKGGQSLRSTPHDLRDYSQTGRSAALCTDFVKGRCHRGESCKYPHDTAFHEPSRASPNDIIRDRENNRSKEAYFSRGEREPCSSSSLVVCKFFSAGNCRHGNNCKFSHRASPARKPSTDRFEQVQHSDGRERLWDGSKPSELASGADFTQLRVDENERIGSQEPRRTWSSEQKLDHDLNMESKNQWNQSASINTVKSYKNDTILNKAEDAGGCMDTFDMEMSPDWHYPVQSSNRVAKGDCNAIHDSGSKTSIALATLSHAIVQEAMSTKQDISLEPITFDNAHLQQNHNLSKDVTIASAFIDKITIDKTIASHAEGNPSTAYQTYPGGTVRNPKVSDGNFRVKLQEDGSMPRINPGTTITPNIVTSEQLTQLTNLTVSLAQYFGNVQPLPQLFTSSLNTHTHNVPCSNAPVSAFGASMKTVSVTEYDSTICNSLELKKLEANKTRSDGLLNSTGRLSTPETAYGEAMKARNDGDNQNKIGTGENEDSEENDTREIANGNDEAVVVHEKKKGKGGKGIRDFKFALVELVKELLKPTWKEGHISKDVYKTIVKKVVEKVTGSLQKGHIPQTQVKIDHYISSSKPKLTKLVQAYVDRVQKTTTKTT